MKEQKYLLSVIVISRNEEKNIANCVDSVLEATRGIDAEIILVDSLSDDKTLEVAKKFPIRILQLEDKSQISPSAGRWVGFMNSSGKYVQFVDGDMILHEKWIYRAISFLEREKDNSIAAVSGSIRQSKTKDPYFAKLGAYLKKSTETTKVGEIRSLFGTFLIRAHILQEVGSFDPYLKACEEGDLSDRIYAKGGRIILLPYISAFHHLKKDYSLMAVLRRRLQLRIAEGQVLRKSLFNRRVFLYRLVLYRYHVLFAIFVIFSPLNPAIFLILESAQFVCFWLFSLSMCFALLVIQEKGNITNAFYHLIVYLFSWCFILRGFFKARKDLNESPIKAKVIKG